MYELVDTGGATLQFYGSVFVPEIITTKEIAVEGDLVCNYVCAPKVTVTHGSLLARYIDCPAVAAEILGVFDLTQPFAAPPGWAYVWLRPCRVLPAESDTEPTTTIERVAALLRDPAIVRDATRAEALLQRTLARPSCARARVLFAVVIEELRDHPDALTPLGEQVLACIAAQPRLPMTWRY